MHIEQLLHGYNNGHHLIAGSVSLPLKDADRMSYLSDWSGYVNPFDKDTRYLTAYPLVESRKYVIAMSWYADEMNRPGCAWTHSLVVDLNKLERGTNLYDLLKLFRRPDRDGDDFLSYTKSLDVNDNQMIGNKSHIEGVDETRFMIMAASLMERNKPLVFAVEKESNFYIDLCMRLVESMPCQFLTDLAICSGSASARKIGDGFYNLQFVTGRGESLTEPYLNKERPIADSGFKFWMDSLLEGRDDVPQMIHRFSEDIGKDSNKFLATCNLLRILDERIKDSDKDYNLKDLIKHLAAGFPQKNDGLSLKRTFLNEGVTKLFCNDKLFILTLSTTTKNSSFDYQQIGFWDRVEKYRQTNENNVFVELLEILSKSDVLNDEGQKLLSNAMSGMSSNEKVEFAGRNWYLFQTIVTLNPNLLADDFWLALPQLQFVSLFLLFQKELPQDYTSWEKLYNKLLTIDTYVTDSVSQIFAKNVDGFVSKALNSWNSQVDISINKQIMVMCMRNVPEVLMWMGQQNSITDIIRHYIKNYIRPDETLVVEAGSAKWKTFVKEELAAERSADELVFIYVLAFNWYDYVSLGYIKGVLPFIYDALSVENFKYSSWKRIEKFTGSVPFWRSWDNCRKVLIGVKDYCKVLNVDARDIENFTSNSKLNQELLDLWKKG